MKVLTRQEEHFDADSLPLAPGSIHELVRRGEEQTHHLQLGLALHAL